MAFEKFFIEKCTNYLCRKRIRLARFKFKVYVHFHTRKILSFSSKYGLNSWAQLLWMSTNVREGKIQAQTEEAVLPTPALFIHCYYDTCDTPTNIIIYETLVHDHMEK